METSSSDEQQKTLNSKYQKLAAEYAKLRSQVQVLKKAVLDEQTTSTRLREQVGCQDQSLRKLEQELDSVKFRNRQLEKRIEILQQPADNNSGSQQQLVACSPQVDSNLLLHVEQNKQLQETLAQVNEKYSVEVGRLKRMIDHEMVPRELLDSLKQEHNEKMALVNKRIKELVVQNNELVDERNSRENLTVHQSDTAGEANTHSELVKKLMDCEVEKEALNSDVRILSLKLKRLHEQGIVKSPSTEQDLVDSNMVGSMELVDHEVLESVLRKRNSELVRLASLADSKAVYYYHEAINLCRLIRSTQLTYKRLDSEFNKLKVKYRSVQDELDDIKFGYEQQVNNLTEHIAILNEKLASMVEEIANNKQASGCRR